MKESDLVKLADDLKQTFDESGTEKIDLNMVTIRTTEDVKKVKDFLKEKGYEARLVIEATVNDSFRYNYRLNSYHLSIRRSQHA